jgi:hypothetical protein
VLNRLWKLVNDRLNYLTPTPSKPSATPAAVTAGAAGSMTSPRPRWTGCWPSECCHQPSK